MCIPNLFVVFSIAVATIYSVKLRIIDPVAFTSSPTFTFENESIYTLTGSSYCLDFTTITPLSTSTTRPSNVERFDSIEAALAFVTSNPGTFVPDNAAIPKAPAKIIFHTHYETSPFMMILFLIGYDQPVTIIVTGYRK